MVARANSLHDKYPMGKEVPKKMLLWDAEDLERSLKLSDCFEGM